MNQVKGYVLAMVAIATENKTLLQLRNEASAVALALDSNPDYGSLLSKNFFSLKQRKELVLQAFKNLSVPFQNLLMILLDTNRTFLLRDIAMGILQQANMQLGIRMGVVYSTKPLGDATITKMEQKTATLLGVKTVALANKIDNDLVLGFRIVVDDFIFEDSLQSRISDLHVEMLERSV